jgi:hypothetical protein
MKVDDSRAGKLMKLIRVYSELTNEMKSAHCSYFFWILSLYRIMVAYYMITSKNHRGIRE